MMIGEVTVTVGDVRGYSRGALAIMEIEFEALAADNAESLTGDIGASLLWAGGLAARHSALRCEVQCTIRLLDRGAISPQQAARLLQDALASAARPATQDSPPAAGGGI